MAATTTRTAKAAAAAAAREAALNAAHFALGDAKRATVLAEEQAEMLRTPESLANLVAARAAEDKARFVAWSLPRP